MAILVYRSVYILEPWIFLLLRQKIQGSRLMNISEMQFTTRYHGTIVGGFVGICYHPCPHYPWISIGSSVGLHVGRGVMKSNMVGKSAFFGQCKE